MAMLNNQMVDTFFHAQKVTGPSGEHGEVGCKSWLRYFHRYPMDVLASWFSIENHDIFWGELARSCRCTSSKCCMQRRMDLQMWVPHALVPRNLPKTIAFYIFVQFCLLFPMHFSFFPENRGEHHKHSAPNPVVTYAAVFLLPFLARCDMIWAYMGWYGSCGSRFGNIPATLRWFLKLYPKLGATIIISPKCLNITPLETLCVWFFFGVGPIHVNSYIRWSWGWEQRNKITYSYYKLI